MMHRTEVKGILKTAHDLREVLGKYIYRRDKGEGVEFTGHAAGSSVSIAPERQRAFYKMHRVNIEQCK